MQVIPTRIHGVMDYLVSAVLIAAPWLLGFARGGAETWIFVFLGAAGIVYSLLTDYELGVARRIPMPVHLALDMANGLILALSPWLFGFADEVWVPHLAFGLLEIFTAGLSERRPRFAGQQDRHGRQQARA